MLPPVTQVPSTRARPTAGTPPARGDGNGSDGSGQHFGGEPPISGRVPEPLQRELQELFGLGLYESRVLLSLLRLASASAAQIAQFAGVPRTSVYQALQSLSLKGLAERLPAGGTATWACPSREAVLSRLDAILEESQEQRRQALEERTAAEIVRASTLRHVVAQTFGAASKGTGAYVHILGTAARVKQAYEEILAGASIDVMMFTVPPYAAPAGYVNPAVLGVLERRVPFRAVYAAGHTDQPEFVDYHRAGVEARVVADLPMKLVLVDRERALIGLTDPVLAENGYPVTMLIEHPGFAGFLAACFELTWETGVPYEPPVVEAGSAGGGAQADESGG